jgi:ABC transporter DrrB family efflux protein
VFTRVPTTIVFMTLQPIIFVLMFRYVFGGSIRVPGIRYVDFLMCGIFVQTMCFSAQSTAIGLAADLQTGLIERFRSLPMARSAVLAGRVGADIVRSLFVIALMVAMGYLVGFRVHTNVLAFAAAVGLLLLFSMAISWIMAFVGLATGNPEAAQAASFPAMALLVFASNAFVLPQTMPWVLRGYAEHQPISVAVDAVRALLLGGATVDKVMTALVWIVGISAVFAALSVRMYRRVA